MKPTVTIFELEEGESMDCAGREVWGECVIEVTEHEDGGTDYLILIDEDPNDEESPQPFQGIAK